jgi:hypothetical protein
MVKVRQMGLVVAAILSLLLQFTLAHAEIPPDHQETLRGTVNSINASQNILIVNDMTYLIDKDLVVKTATGKIGRLAQLYPGKRIRMDVLYSGSGTRPPIIRTIYMLR